MGYTPQTWVDGAGGGTPLEASRFTIMETGIADASNRLDLEERPMAGDRIMSVVAQQGGSTYSTFGSPGGWTVGGGANGDDVDGPWITCSTAATLNTHAGIAPPSYVLARPGWVPDVDYRLRTDASAITTVRYLIGFVSALPDAASTPTTLHGAWFRYDTGLDGTAFWRTVTAAGGTPSVVATTASIAVNSVYRLRIKFVGTRGADPTVVQFFVNDILVSTHALTLPAANQTMSPTFRVTTLAAAIRSIKFGKMVLGARA